MKNRLRHRPLLTAATLAASAAVLALWAPVASAQPATSSIYTCVDAQGRRLTSDRPIMACNDREQRELNRSGTTKRVVGPTLTAKEREAEEARQREADLDRQRARDAIRRDEALITRYPNQAAHDDGRKKALAQSQTIVDAAKDRIAIFGYSYGGFAAAAATVRSPSPYQCAIAGAPVTDLGRLGTSWSQNRLQRILQGRTVKGMDPMQNTDKANIPVLLYVGDRDVRTPAFHARDFYEAVKGKVPAKFALIPDMPHSMPWYPRHQTQTLGLIENFLRTECNAAR